jgi:hypothetical protein
VDRVTSKAAKVPFAQIFQDEWRKKFKSILAAEGSDALVLYLFLRTCPHRNMSGIYYIPISTMAHDTSIDVVRVEELVMSFEQMDLCSYDYRTEEIFLFDMLETQVGGYLKEDDKRSKMVMRHFYELESDELRSDFWERFSGLYVHGF